MKKQKQVHRDYNQYKQRNVQSVNINTEKPLMNIIVFICSVAIIICLFFPLVNAYVWSDGLSFTTENGFVFAVTTYKILDFVVGSAEGLDISDIGSIVDIEDDNNLLDVLNIDEEAFKPLLTKMAIMGGFGVGVLALAIALLVVSMCGVVGAKKTEVAVKILSCILFVAALGLLIVATQVYISQAVLYGLGSIVIKFSFGSCVVLFFALASVGSALFVKR